MKKETELCFPVYSSPPKFEGDAPHLGGLDWCQHTNGTIGLMAEHINRMPNYLAANMTWTFHLKKLDTSNIIKLVIIDEE
jgi:hypothetical protein